MDSKKESYIRELKEFFGADERRIAHALSVLRFAEEILEAENVSDKNAVIAASVFHDIGIREGERLYPAPRRGNAPKYQEELGPPLARSILVRLSADENLIADVCGIIAHHHHPARYEKTYPDKPKLPFRILVDADLIVNVLEGDITLKNGDKFYTEAARKIASREGCF